MKQSAAKTLGVAALGAAFAAAGAGVASAAPASAVPDVAGPGNVTQTLPTDNVGNIAKVLPGAGQALGPAQGALGGAITAARPAAQKVVADGPAAPVAACGGATFSKPGCSADCRSRGRPCTVCR